MAMISEFEEAFRIHRAGGLSEAVPKYRAILAQSPAHRDALYCLALARLQQNDTREGEALLQRLLVTAPDHLGGLRQLGLLHQRLGRDADALASFERALRLAPKDVANWRSQALSLYRLNRFAEALRNYDEVLAIEPDHAETLCDRGVVLHRLERFDEALESFDQALAIAPRQVVTLINQAVTLNEVGRFTEALENYDRVLAIDPHHVDALYNRGTSLLALKRFEEALQSFDRVLTVDPHHVFALNNRAGVLRELNRMQEALASYDRAVALEPNSASLRANRGALLLECHRYNEALVDCETALLLDAKNPRAFDGAASAAVKVCDWSRTKRYAHELEEIDGVDQWPISPFTALSYFDEPSLQLEFSKQWVKEKFPTITPAIYKVERRSRRGKARIAYVSSDFHEHATSYLIAELFERHDRKRFELFGISFGPDDESEMRARLVEALDHFHDVRGQNDLQVAKLIGGLGIDIAVDLKGHTKNSRFGIFAHRPAPVQVSYLGFPGTTGADFIDYVIADETVLPSDQQPFWTEKIVRLPDCYQVNDRKRQIAARTPTRKECGLPERGFVFCCFNSNYKITPPVFDIWMRLLAKVEGSALWLLHDNAAAERNLRKEAAARGIDPARLVFADRLPLAEHLARHRLPDLFLDTLPYNAHTTASDALWAGLPVLACLGKTFTARVAGSLNRAVGVPELVTTSLDHYEALALALANEPSLLRSYRKRLAKNRLTAPLFDTDRLCRHLEQAYLTMLDIARSGEAPRSFTVEPAKGRSRRRAVRSK